MAAPTQVSVTSSNYDDAVTTAESVTISWQAGDLIIVLGGTEGQTQTLATPTATGLTFTPIVVLSSASNSNTYAWQATAAADGTDVTVSCTTDGGIGGRGITAFVYRDHDGIGNWASVEGQAGTTLSVNRGQDNAHVLMILNDFSASADVTVTGSPSGETQHIANENAGRWTAFVFSWPDQGAAGTTAYGFSAGGSTDNSMIVLEIRGTSVSHPADRFMSFRKA